MKRLLSIKSQVRASYAPNSNCRLYQQVNVAWPRAQIVDTKVERNPSNQWETMHWNKECPPLGWCRLRWRDSSQSSRQPKGREVQQVHNWENLWHDLLVDVPYGQNINHPARWRTDICRRWDDWQVLAHAGPTFWLSKQRQGLILDHSGLELESLPWSSWSLPDQLLCI